MMSRSFTVQILLILVAVMILVFFIKPTVEEIRSIQDKHVVYEQETVRIQGVNDVLNSHIATIEAVSLTDTQALERYIPTQLDEVSVLRDLQTILDMQGVVTDTLAYVGPVDLATSDETGEVVAGVVPAGDFSIDITVSYPQLKDLLAAFEINAYPLEVMELAIDPIEADILNVKMQLRAYALTVKSDDSAELSANNE